MPSEPVVLGRIVGLFGVRGWIKVFSYTEPREAVLQYQGLQLTHNGNSSPLVFAEGQRHGKSVIARIEGVDDREQAAMLVGAELSVEREQLPDAGDGQFYWSDLIGLQVVHCDGTVLGKVTSMLETGAHDVMVVNGEQERIIPFVMDKFIIGVDLGKGQIDVDWEWD